VLASEYRCGCLEIPERSLMKPPAGPNGGVGVDSAITETISSGIPIVRHVRINVGMIAPSETPRNGSVISSGLINNQKSRIQLQLALATGADPRAVFEDALREELYGN
jgi:L-asparaginase